METRIVATKEVKSAERGEARGGMRTGAIVIGIIAGLAGLVSAVLALMVDWREEQRKTFAHFAPASARGGDHG